MTRPRHNERAFTLLELLLVCVLVAILVALVAPSLTASQGRARLDATARALVAFSRAGRARASADGRAYFLIVDQTTRQARLGRQRDPLASPDAESDAETEGDTWTDGAPWARTFDFPDDVNVAFASTTYQDVQTSTVAGMPAAGSNALAGQPLPVGVQLAVEGKPARVAFQPDGTSDDATFDLVGADNAKVRVIIDSPSGHARILTNEELTDALQAQQSASTTTTVGATVLGTVQPLPSPAAGGN